MIIKLERLIEIDFQVYLNRKDRKISEETKNRYKNDLHFYLNNCISSLTVFDEYKDYFNIFALRDYHEKRKTATARYAISNLVDYLKIIEKLNASDYLQIKNELKQYYKEKKAILDFHTEEDIQYLLSYKYDYGKKRGKEEKLVTPIVVSLSYYALFEQGHISNIQIKHLDFTNSRIKNIRSSQDSLVNEWIPLNNSVIQLIINYLDYRNQTNLVSENDYLILLDGEKPNNRTINKVLNLFNNIKGNSNELTTRVNLQKIIRSRILYDLMITNGRSLIDYHSLIGFDKETQITSATKEYFIRVNSKKEYGIR